MKQMKQMKQQSGFTLVELVTTMVIVGTLAAVAVPKFADTSKDARITKLESLRGSVITASGSVHNTVLSKGKIDLANCPGETITADVTAGDRIANNSQGGTGTVCTETGVANLVNGYPAAGTVGVGTVVGTGIINVAGLTAKFRPTVADIQKAGYGVSVTAATGSGASRVPGATTFSVLGGSGTVDSTTTTATAQNDTCKFTYTEAATAGVPPIVSELSSTTVGGC